MSQQEKNGIDIKKIDCLNLLENQLFNPFGG